MSSTIVFGNEKGGSGKSTIAVHVAIALASQGVSVAAIDGDVRQGSLSRFLANRAAFLKKHADSHLPMPELIDALDWVSVSSEQLSKQVRERTEDVIIIDTPGAHTSLSTKLHGCADLIVTPLNDSLVDLSVLAEIEPDTGTVIRPNQYAEVVWQARQARAKLDGGSIGWVVLRNRLSALDAHNKRVMSDILEKSADRLGFVAGPGFGERVIFRELYLQGLTLSDFEDRRNGLAWTVSHVAARQELRDLLDVISNGLKS